MMHAITCANNILTVFKLQIRRLLRNSKNSINLCEERPILNGFQSANTEQTKLPQQTLAKYNDMHTNQSASNILRVLKQRVG
jgi:hypothetical protein